MSTTRDPKRPERDDIGWYFSRSRLPLPSNEAMLWKAVNDIMVQGANPLFFMDYISVGKLVPARICEIMEGFINRFNHQHHSRTTTKYYCSFYHQLF